MDKIEARSVIRYLFLKRKSPKEIHEELTTVYGDDAPSYSMVKQWHKEFRCGRTTVEHAPIPGRPSSAIDDHTIAQVEALILEDRRITVQELVHQVRISVGSIEKIIHDHLNLSKLSARWIPRLVQPFQTQQRAEASREMLDMCRQNVETFFSRLITEDETWIHTFDPETKMESKQWCHRGSPPPRKARVVPSADKVLLTVFWDQEGIILTDYLPKGATITRTYYSNLLVKLRDQIKISRRGKLSKGVLLLQDNAPAHNADVARQQATTCGYTILPHPPYSSDLAPSDIFLFPFLKRFLRGKCFPSNAELISETEAWFRDQNKDFYKDGLRGVMRRWEKCVILKGGYIEKE